MNALIQSGVAEFVKDVMLDVEPLLDQVGARMCLQIHDSLVIEVLPGTGPAVGELLQKVADADNIFEMRMTFSASAWGDHA